MESRLGFLLTFILVASVLCVPALNAESVDSSQTPYLSQLDDNELLIYNSISKATSVESATKEFSVQFDSSRLFSDVATAELYADGTVQNALSAGYLSNPSVPYLWDYPVKHVDTKVSVKMVKIIDVDTGVETTKYVVDSVSFSLTVPEGITADSINELNDAIKDIKVTGKTNADKVKSIMSTLDSLTYEEDKEGEISNIYDALVKKKTTSAGVSQAFTKLCKDNDIPAIIVAGDNLLAAKEAKNFWNYVYLEGDIEGETAYAWYLVDASYANSVGIAGYLTEVTYDGKTYSMLSAHNVDLTLSAENVLTVPLLAKEKYVPVGGPTFLEMYGEQVMLGLLAVILVVAFVYAIRTGYV